MKTTAEIELEIQKFRQLTPIDVYPQIIECWNEYERMWRTDNGRSYTYIIQDKQYSYHLLYLDGRLGIVERAGETIFSHLTPKLLKLMNGDMSDLNLPIVSQDRSLIKFDRLAPDLQQSIQHKYQFPVELQNKLDYRSNGNFVWSTETIEIARKYNLLKN
jgi:hypothetical protein